MNEPVYPERIDDVDPLTVAPVYKNGDLVGVWVKDDEPPSMERMLLDEARETMRRMDKEHGEVKRQRDEVRAILAPLLAEPYRLGYSHEAVRECVFCEQEWSFDHTPDCPVLRRAGLLGENNK